MNIGFSGTRLGLTPQQQDELLRQFHALAATTLHHGDCRGADETAHHIGRKLGLFIVGHPPVAEGLRAHCDCDEWRDPKPFIVRNHVIVQESAAVIACPDGPERLRSGTWSTIRHARRMGVPLVVIMPDGAAQMSGSF